MTNTQHITGRLTPQQNQHNNTTERKMTMRGTVTGCLALVCLVAMLAQQAEGHLTFFSPQEMREMWERQGKVKEPRSEDSQLEEVTIQQLPKDEGGAIPDKTVEIAVRLSAKQLARVAPMLGEVLHEIVEEAERDK